MSEDVWMPIDVADFWEALGPQQEWFEKPQEVSDGLVYKVRARPGYIFDDAFWAVFHCFPFKICHVAYYGPERLEDVDAQERMRDTGVFELRFAPSEQANWQPPLEG